MIHRRALAIAAASRVRFGLGFGLRLQAFGQAGGFSLFAAVCGTLLSRSGLPAAALACALAVGLIFLFFMLTRERIGERLLPWSEG